MSRCVQPIYLRKQNRLVPCGDCWFCRSQKRAQWDFRLIVQAATSAASFFITLTYDSVHLPFELHGYPVLNPKHLTNYWKTLRNHGFNFSYFAIGEYGGKFGRPHYHALIFMDDYFYPVYLKRYWPYGNVKIGSVEPRSVHYVCKFHVMPKERDIFSYQVRPFSRMSKGIGLNWLLEHHFLSPPPSIRFGMQQYPFPRYFRKKLDISVDSDFIFDFPYISNHQLNQYYSELSNRKINIYKTHSNYVYFH